MIVKGMPTEKKEYDVRYTDDIRLAESWQNEGFHVDHIAFGKIFMKRKVSDGLFIKYLENHPEMVERMKQGEQVTIKQADIDKEFENQEL